MKIYNWGIIGAGKIAAKFAQDLKTLPNAKVWAIASTDINRANEFAAKFEVHHAFGDYESIANCPDLDVVYIATPHSGHCSATLLCLNNKIPALCEKPFAMNKGEVQQMIACAKENNTFLMEAIWTRFLPTFDKLLQIIRENTIGKILSIHADFGYQTKFNSESRIFNNKLGGGSLLDVGIYPVFLSLLLLGEPSEIQAKAMIGKTNVDESCAMILSYPNQEFAILNSSIVSKSPTEAYIYGEKGSIKIHGRFHELSPGITLSIYGEEEIFYPFEWNCLGYVYEASEVMKCLAENKKESSTLPLSFSLQLIDILDKIREKAEIKY